MPNQEESTYEMVLFIQKTFGYEIATKITLDLVCKLQTSDPEVIFATIDVS